MLISLLSDWWNCNLEMPTFPPQHGFEKSKCDHYITIIFQQLDNLEALETWKT